MRPFTCHSSSGEGNAEKVRKNRAVEGKEVDARAQTRNAEERKRREGEEPKAGDRDRIVRGAKGGNKGPEEKEDVTRSVPLPMKHTALRFGEGFKVVLGNRRAQAARMVIAPGNSEGGDCNRHASADQWLFVLSGVGVARINDKRYLLREGRLFLIEHGDRHEIRNTGRT